MSRMDENLHPALSVSVLEALFKKSIYSILSFLRTTPEHLAKITGLSYGDILEIKTGILLKFSSSLKLGHKYYYKLIDHSAIISSGIDNFDKLLDSGFLTGNIYELCGFAGCGKTQICKTVTINICKTSPQHVLYIDTKNDISALRFFQIAESKNVLNIDEVLKKIHICQVRTACDLLHQLYQLQPGIKNADRTHLEFKLIVIDSLSSLFQQYLSFRSEGLSVLNNIASLMKYISHEYNVVILLTNFVKSWTDDEIVHQEVQQPALGRYWSSIPDVRIMIKKLNNSNECILVILKSLTQPSGKSVKVKITDDGVR